LSVVAGGLALGVGLAFGQSWSPLARLTLQSTTLLVTFFGSLMIVTAQRSLYLDLLRGLIGSLSTKEEVSVSACKQTI